MTRSQHDQTRARELEPTEAAGQRAAADNEELASEAEARHPAATRTTSGTLPSVADRDGLPMREPGVSVDPEELGTQFLRDATDQDNFESAIDLGERLDGVPLGELVSEATLRSAGQGTLAVPDSTALSDADAGGATLEPVTDRVDLTGNVTGGNVEPGSLFDQPTVDGDVVSPSVDTDETAPYAFGASTPRGLADAGDEEDAGDIDLDDARELDEAGKVAPALRRKAPRPRVSG
jgi:hypothetical protein